MLYWKVDEWKKLGIEDLRKYIDEATATGAEVHLEAAAAYLDLAAGKTGWNAFIAMLKSTDPDRYKSAVREVTAPKRQRAAAPEEQTTTPAVVETHEDNPSGQWTVFTSGEHAELIFEDNGDVTVTACGTFYGLKKDDIKAWEQLRAAARLLADSRVQTRLGLASAAPAPALRIERQDNDSYQIHAWSFKMGEGDTEVELYLPDVRGEFDHPKIYISAREYDLDEVEQMLPNLIALFNDPQVRAARVRSEAGLPAQPLAREFGSAA